MIDADAAEVITPQRDSGDGMGNPNWVDLTPTPMVVDLSGGAQGASERGVAFTQGGQVFVPRTYDLRAGDRITVSSGDFYVTGFAQGDMKHPFTGWDLGWKWYAIRGGR